VRNLILLPLRLAAVILKTVLAAVFGIVKVTLLLILGIFLFH
jgi:hypothetical protein